MVPLRGPQVSLLVSKQFKKKLFKTNLGIGRIGEVEYGLAEYVLYKY